MHRRTGVPNTTFDSMADHDLSGWGRFFGELSSFLADINRHRGKIHSSVIKFKCDDSALRRVHAGLHVQVEIKDGKGI